MHSDEFSKINLLYGADSLSGSEEILCLLWNLKVFYLVHKVPTQYLVRSQKSTLSHPISVFSYKSSFSLRFSYFNYVYISDLSLVSITIIIYHY
jgi:hypothetical protein